MRLEKVLEAVNWLYLVSVGIAAALSVMIYLVSKELNEQHDRELRAFQAESAARVAEAQASAATANERAADAERETERLRQQYAWRRVSQGQIEVLREALAGSEFTVHLQHVLNDPESTVFCEDLRAALTAAGVDVHPQTRMYGPVMPVFGVIIPRTADGRSTRVADALRAVGIDSTPGEPSDRVIVRVGSRPPPK